ncbi:MAG: hypothetical protein ACJ8KU_08290 [Chthoniobacterales bacterium]
MKTSGLLLCAGILAAAVQFAPSADGQDRGDKSERRFPERNPRWQSLSEPERAKLRAAHDQALQDAQVRAAHERLIQARREFREVMRPALIKADPSVQPILEKLRTNRRNRD